jgi:hypothetical protein
MAIFEILIVVGCWVVVFVLAYVLRWLWSVVKAINIVSASKSECKHDGQV